MLPVMSTQPSQRALDARRARTAQIRTLRLRIVAIGVAIFVAAWVVIFVQLTTGHDPALAKATDSSVAASEQDISEPTAALAEPTDVTTSQS